ncbi:hypothetical protein FOMPIDRAFT_1119460, partial [Fomitopsis schrenkii]
MREVRAQRIVEEPELRTREAQQLAENRPHSAPAPVEDDLSALDATVSGPPLPTVVTKGFDFIQAVKDGYPLDRTLKKVLDHPDEHRAFRLADGIIWYIRPGKSLQEDVLCVPRSTARGRRLTEIVLDEAHKAIGHLGARRTSDYVRRWYWW